jgi:hypothetical protein
MSTNEAAERLDISQWNGTRATGWIGPRGDFLPWRTDLSPTDYATDLAAAKAEGAREAVERIRAGMKARSVARGNVYWAVMGLLDEEAAR